MEGFQGVGFKISAQIGLRERNRKSIQKEKKKKKEKEKERKDCADQVRPCAFKKHFLISKLAGEDTQAEGAIAVKAASRLILQAEAFKSAGQWMQKPSATSKAG
eukprot:scaffold77107_cov16-Tisochrysis_lutea.AAC.1